MKMKAKDGTTVILTKHALERAAERGMSKELIKHTIDSGELIVSKGGKPQWHAVMSDGKSRSVLAVDVRGGMVLIPSMWIRGPMAGGK
jgi:hypothetical protein